MAKTSSSEPLDTMQIVGQRQLKNLNSALSQINKGIEECDLAESCGKDCSDQRAEFEDIRQRIMAIKAKYHPDQP